VVEDCTSSRKIHDKNVAIWRMRDAGATLSTYESTLYELCRESGSEEFKQITKLVK
jgi:hypothetical protein